MKKRKDYIANYMANSQCLFCGADCDHVYEGKIKHYQRGRFDFVYVVNKKTKDIVVWDTCWICKDCFKELFLKGGEKCSG